VATALELLRQGRRNEIWKKYCGFLDLSLAETMQIQERLLLEQLRLLGTSELGRELLGGHVPTTVDGFRQNVPLTTYRDYSGYLLDKREDVLPRQPQWWLHTSGRSGEYTLKWVPYTPQMVQRLNECAMATLILASCSHRGEFVFEEGDVMLFTLAPFPYVSGALARGFQKEFGFTFIPPLELAESMDFAERIQEGFRLGLKTGLDAFNGVASVLVRIGEQFAEQPDGIKFSTGFLHPAVLTRFVRAFIRSRLAGRNYLLPRDLWAVKCIGTGSTDTALFRKQIEEYWGRTPIEAYGCTEGGIISVQLWNAKGLTFFPDSNFLEFIPEEECLRSHGDPDFVPSTVTLDQLEPGQRYEIVLTNLLGGVFIRYRVGDLIEITALRDDELDVDIPQMLFHARADDIIDLASFTRLTEKTIWQALEASGVRYTDWTATKEYEGQKVLLHIYLEPKDGAVDAEAARDRVHQALLDLDPFYADLHSMLGVDPLRLTLLSRGSFERYYLARQAAGSDLAHMKPPHMNAAEAVLRKLLQASEEGE
jgi:hypothetical protein